LKSYEVTPEQIRDYLSLVGDASDNVPGFPVSVRKRPQKYSKNLVQSTMH